MIFTSNKTVLVEVAGRFLHFSANGTQIIHDAETNINSISSQSQMTGRTKFVEGLVDRDSTTLKFDHEGIPTLLNKTKRELINKVE